MEKLKKLALKLVIAATIICIIVFSFLYWGVYSKGVHSGIIIKVAERGVVFKTVEGEMNTQVLAASADLKQVSEIWKFSVDKDHQELIEKLQKASLTGERVELTYIKRYRKFAWRGETEFFVTGITLNEK